MQQQQDSPFQQTYLDPAGALSMMFNQFSATMMQVQQGQTKLNTDMAVLATDVRNITTHMQSIERGFDTRVKDLEAARLTEATQMGGMRADFATQIAQAIIIAQRTANESERTQNDRRSANAAQWGSQLSSAVIAAGISLIGIIVTLLVVLAQIHH